MKYNCPHEDRVKSLPLQWRGVWGRSQGPQPLRDCFVRLHNISCNSINMSLFTQVPVNYLLTSGAGSALTWTNAVSVSSMTVSSLGASNLSVSTLTTSSSVTASTLTTGRLNYSSIVGSSISTNSMTLSLTNASTQNTQIYQVATTDPTTSYTAIQASHVSTGTTNNSLALNPSGGNVGVGTTAPAALLDVNGAARIAGVLSFPGAGGNTTISSNMIQLISSTAHFRSFNGGYPPNSSPIVRNSISAYYGTRDGVTSRGAGIDFVDVSYNSSYPTEIRAGEIQFYTASAVAQGVDASQRMVIMGTGTVGIGTTTPESGVTTTIPNAKLSILGGTPGQANGKSRISVGGDSSHYSAIEAEHIGSGATTLSLMTCYDYIVNSGNPLTRMFIAADGNVGINTTTPLCQLYQNGGAGTTGWTGQTYIGNTTRGVILGTFNNVATIGGHTAALGAWADLSINTGGGNVGIGTATPSATLQVNGSLAKSSGTFDIEHPLHIGTNKRLVHSFIEGPRCDLIYRGKTTLINGSAVVNIDKECTQSPECAMDEGTFEALCNNPQIFLQNNKTFDRVRGVVSGATLTITCETPAAVEIEWMVIAERADPFIKQWNRTNPDGYLVTQYGGDAQSSPAGAAGLASVPTPLSGGASAPTPPSSGEEAVPTDPVAPAAPSDPAAPTDPVAPAAPSDPAASSDTAVSSE